MKETTKERFMYFLGGFVVAISAVVIVLLIYQPLPQENKDIVNIALGTLLGMAVTVVGYFFGSSKSSSDKNALISGKSEEKQIP